MRPVGGQFGLVHATRLAAGGTRLSHSVFYAFPARLAFPGCQSPAEAKTFWEESRKNRDEMREQYDPSDSVIVKIMIHCATA